MFHVSRVNASVLFFHPQNEVIVEEGETVIVEARLDTESKAINALDIILSFPSDIFEVVDVSRGDSVAKLWITDPIVDSVAGTVRFTGGIPNGGVFDAGLVGRITFRAKVSGRGALRFAPSSQALLNDGQGTPDTVRVLVTPIIATPAADDVPKISSITHRNSSEWYQEKNLFVAWQLLPDAVYSYALDHDPQAVPDETPDVPAGDLRFAGTIKYEGLDEGMYYFHLRQGTTEGDVVRWSRTRTFRVQIDGTPPSTLISSVGSDPTVYDGKLFAGFSGTDALSGIARYDVWEPSTDWVRNAKPPHELRDQGKTGDIKIRAVDKAGNIKEITVEAPQRPGKPIMPYGILLIVAVLMLAVSGAWKYRRNNP